MQSLEIQNGAEHTDYGHALLEMVEAADGLAAAVARSFPETLRRIVARVVGDGPEADQALAEGGFVMNGSTVVLRLNPESSFVEFFCDVGQPDAYSLEGAYRTALEANLCRTFPGITLGIHPESGRLVATLALNGLMVDDEDFCMMLLETLTLRVTQIRESGMFKFEG